VKKGQVIIITGTSGAGKTTTSQAWARRAESCYFMFGFDQLVSVLVAAKYTNFGPKAEEYFYDIPVGPDNPGPARMGFGPAGIRAVSAMHEMIAAASNAGQDVVVDHLTFVDPPVLQDCVWRLQDVPVLFVALKPPKEVLAERLITRQFAIPPSISEAMAGLGEDALKQIAARLQAASPWFYDAAYANDIYDLVIDSTSFTPDEVCQQIERRLAEGPGTAFARLRERYSGH
jgi:chloramphenicol 3-O-phosphotransferase